MMVRPELMSARSAPSARPLKSCETKFDQLIMASAPRAAEAARGAGPRCACGRSGVVAQLAAELVRLLHERRARHDLLDVPVIVLVLHVGGLLALHDDHRAHELVVLLAEVHLAHGGLELAPLLVR